MLQFSSHFESAQTIDESSWIAARSPRAKTGATYILVGGWPIKASERNAQFYVEWIDELIEISELQGTTWRRRSSVIVMLIRSSHSGQPTRVADKYGSTLLRIDSLPACRQHRSMVKESPLRLEQTASEYLPFGTGNQGVRSIHRAPFYRAVEVVTALIGQDA